MIEAEFRRTSEKTLDRNLPSEILRMQEMQERKADLIHCFRRYECKVDGKASTESSDESEGAVGLSGEQKRGADLLAADHRSTVAGSGL